MFTVSFVLFVTVILRRVLKDIFQGRLTTREFLSCYF